LGVSSNRISCVSLRRRVIFVDYILPWRRGSGSSPSVLQGKKISFLFFLFFRPAPLNIDKSVGFSVAWDAVRSPPPCFLGPAGWGSGLGSGRGLVPGLRRLCQETLFVCHWALIPRSIYATHTKPHGEGYYYAATYYISTDFKSPKDLILNFPIGPLNAAGNRAPQILQVLLYNHHHCNLGRCDCNW